MIDGFLPWSVRPSKVTTESDFAERFRMEQGSPGELVAKSSSDELGCRYPPVTCSPLGTSDPNRPARGLPVEDRNTTSFWPGLKVSYQGGMGKYARVIWSCSGVNLVALERPSIEPTSVPAGNDEVKCVGFLFVVDLGCCVGCGSTVEYWRFNWLANVRAGVTILGVTKEVERNLRHDAFFLTLSFTVEWLSGRCRSDSGGFDDSQRLIRRYLCTLLACETELS
jgi:hypothetical protein